MTPSVVHVITALHTGGAERMLTRLLAESEPLRRQTAAVVTLVPGGELEAGLRATGVPVRSLGLARGQVSPAALARLAGSIGESGAGLVHAWMYHACLATSLAMRLHRRRVPVIWNVRHALHAQREERWLTSLVIRTGAFLSRQPRRIVYNSATSRAQHAAIGYDDARAAVIPNGFALPCVDAELARADARRELGLSPDSPVVGVVARLDPLKDFRTLLAAFRDVASRRPGARLVIAGQGASWDEPAFARLVDEARVRPYVLPLGRRADVERIYPAFDVAVSASLSEAFPNAIGEAMAAGVPAIVTDVGDCRMLVGDTGRTVPSRDAAALARAMDEVLSLPADARSALGRRARARIAAEFSIDAVTRRYEQLHADVATGA